MKTKIAVVIPCYRVKAHIQALIESILHKVDSIYVVDDKCPESTGLFVEEKFAKENNVNVIFHDQNQGVGGAMISGYKAAIENNDDIVVKMDGDGQMDAQFLNRLINPILKEKADFCKANRFYDLIALDQMPWVRRIGNLGLSVLTKAASGNWHISDPTNGYIAISTQALKQLNLDALSKNYFFETSMLIQLNIIRAVIIDIPIPAKYDNEQSSLSIRKTLLTFPFKLTSGLFYRLFWRYFIYDINAVTIFLILGTIIFASGVSFGAYRWILGGIQGVVQTAGTVALAFLPTLLGFQMLLQAILLDVIDRPTQLIGNLIDDKEDH